MQVFLETERMVLRHFTAADVDLLVDLDSDPEVMRFLTGGIPTPREAIQNDILPAFLRSYEPFSGFGVFAAIGKEGGEFLGWFSFRPKDVACPDEVSLGYRLRRSAWGQGYATEGARALIRLGFTELGVQRVVASTYQDNLASRRVMEKAGLSLVRTYRMMMAELQAHDSSAHDPSEELWDGDDVEYALRKADWEQQEELQRKETMPSNTYLSTTWYDLRVEVQPSSIHGMGMFASQPIHEGEIVVRIGGTVMTEEEFRVYISKVSRYNAVQIGEARHLVDVPKALGGMNHSCDANLWMRDEVTVVARRDIAAGKELTQDYALYTTSPTWTMRPCRCGTPVCRQVITGNDWQRPEVQERYRDHFSPFLNERIRRLREK